MKSHELLRQVCKVKQPKNVAEQLGLSVSLIHQWSRPRGGNESGAPNPLDRLEELMRATDPQALAQWVCERAGGYYVPNTRNGKGHSKDLLTEENHLVADFGQLLQLIAAAAKDKVITPEEAASIRTEWERMKSEAEYFVVCSERGDFKALRSALAKLQARRPPGASGNGRQAGAPPHSPKVK